MNTFLSRLNGLFAFTLTVLACVTLACYFSVIPMDRSLDSASATVYKRVQVKNIRNRFTTEPNDLAQLSLDISANFTKLFNWNTKQLFVYVLATYETDIYPVNQIVLWDKIILRGERAVLDLHDVNTKYLFLDDGTGMRGGNFSLELCWNIIPIAGDLPRMYSPKTWHTFPAQYSSS